MSDLDNARQLKSRVEPYRWVFERLDAEFGRQRVDQTDENHCSEIRAYVYGEEDEQKNRNELGKLELLNRNSGININSSPTPREDLERFIDTVSRKA